MKKVYSLRDVEEMIRRGEDLNAIPGDAILTPSARDLLREQIDHPRAAAPPPAGAGCPAGCPAVRRPPGAAGAPPDFEESPRGAGRLLRYPVLP